VVQPRPGSVGRRGAIGKPANFAGYAMYAGHEDLPFELEANEAGTRGPQASRSRSRFGGLDSDALVEETARAGMIGARPAKRMVTQAHILARDYIRVIRPCYTSPEHARWRGRDG
jgi:hypothetical protein